MTTIIACSIFKDEIEALKKDGLLDYEVKYITSMLHLNPAKLDLVLHKELVRHKNENVTLAYGDCSPTILGLSHRDNVELTPVHNCCELLLGNERYLRHLKDGAFFLMPEWVRKWRGIFVKFMNLEKDVAVDMMQHLHRYFLYLDTGVVPVPREKLDEISDYFELPWKIEKTDIKGNFLTALKETIEAQETD
ncbi:MAG: DUF1638 domain-containing protein [Candidatus Thiodiazotropha sp.]